MRNFIQKLIKNDNIDYDFKLNEDFRRLEITITSLNLLFDHENFNSVLNDFIDNRDSLEVLKFQIDEYDSTIMTSNNYSNFFSEVTREKKYKEESDIEKLTIVISKKNLDNYLSIYNLTAFSNYLDSLNLVSLCNNLARNPKPVCFVLKYYYRELKSNSNIFYFITEGMIKDFSIPNFVIDSKKRIELRDANCNIDLSFVKTFEPNNFIFSESINYVLDNIFEKLKIIFSLISVFDESKNENNKLILILKSKVYKSFELYYENINVNNLSKFILINEWVYKDENINDRLLISRNVLSTYVLSSNSLIITDELINAIESNYKIYLKENFEQYVKIKNDIIDSLIKIEIEMLNIMNNFTDNFIKNIGALCTFIFSLIILNSFSDKKFANIFTKDITLISIVLIIVSFIFLYMTEKETKSKYEIITSINNKIKSNYQDLLTPKQVSEIFNDLTFGDYNQSIVKKKIKFFKRCWIVILISFCICILTLGNQHFIYVFDKIKEFITLFIK